MTTKQMFDAISEKMDAQHHEVVHRLHRISRLEMETLCAILELLQAPTSGGIPAALGEQIDALKVKLKASGDALTTAVDSAPPTTT